MAITPISGIPVPATTAPTPSTPGPAPTDGVSFLDGLKDALDGTGEANALAQQLATGELTDVHTFTVAAEKAALAVELTVAIRDRALSAYQEVMRMQL